MTLTLQPITELDMQNRPIAYDEFQDPWDTSHSAVFRVAVMNDPNLKGMIALQYSHTGTQRHLPTPPENWYQDKDYVAPYIAQIKAYLAGEIPQWDTPVLLKASGFTLSAWQVLSTVGYGETISYTALAEKAGNPKAVRAAASACANNPIPLILPCHRILAKDGTLGGFAWGLTWKQRLLAMESTRAAAQSKVS